MKTTKSDRFCRVAEARVNKIIDMIELLGNCSKETMYEYTEEQVHHIFSALHMALDDAEKRFTEPDKARFSLMK